jgi:hypothetical protein
MKTRFDKIREEAVKGIEKRLTDLNELHKAVKYTDKLFMDRVSVNEFLERLSEIQKLTQEIFEPSPDQIKSLDSVQKMEEFYFALTDLLDDN